MISKYCNGRGAFEMGNRIFSEKCVIMKGTGRGAVGSARRLGR